ncbi:RNA 3'-terminal phosphate cyclase [Candidatus Woesearchaeota archaeon]|nr:RNA 3'-terminal phosphate cyclase [Candidatus Woesearchaeota archaeon]
MIRLDGSHGEGGGQIVRTALALSSVSGLPFEVFSIRKGRCDSGLKSQHVSCVRALQELSGAKCEGAFLGSEELSFFPGKVSSRTLSVDVGTAGSLTLLLQSLLLPVVFGEGRVRLRLVGGTDVPWSQPYDYFREVLVPQVARFCSRLDVSLVRRGYFPAGGGRMEVVAVPRFRVSDFASFQGFVSFVRAQGLGFDLSVRGPLLAVRGVSHASMDLSRQEVAERQASSARAVLSSLGCPVRIDVAYSDSLSTGSGICVWAVFGNARGEMDSLNPVVLGSDSLGSRGKRAEEVGREAAVGLLREVESGACVDRFLADQLLPFMAFCGGRFSASELSPHCLTNVHVVEQFLGRVFEVDAQSRSVQAVF